MNKIDEIFILSNSSARSIASFNVFSDSDIKLNSTINKLLSFCLDFNIGKKTKLSELGLWV